MSNTPLGNELSEGILANRKSAILVFLLFVLFGILSVRSILRNNFTHRRPVYFFGAHLSHDPILIFGMGSSIFVVVSIALRSPLRADRFVFGAAAVPFAISLAREFAPLPAPVVLALHAADALIWLITAGMSAVVLANYKSEAS